jgi:signal transduction histidine kinase
MFRSQRRSTPAGVRTLKRTIEGLPDQTALLDQDWKVLAVSAAWARQGNIRDMAPIVPGNDFRALTQGWLKEGRVDAALLAAAIDDLSAGRTKAFHHVFQGPVGAGGPTFAVNMSCLEIEGARFYTITRCDVSNLQVLAERCRELEASLLQTREDERKRIGRDLHDSTSQLLVGLKLCMMRLKEARRDTRSERIFREMDDILLDMDQEIRSISFLLHPPRLQGRGLAQALRYMVSGFARRSGLEIGVDVVGELPARMPEIETSLYRLTQEALANVYRHAAATAVTVRLVVRNGRFVHLLIADDGIGLDREGQVPARPGVGIEGMAARVADLGGRFSFRYIDRGCRLLASIPLRAAPQLASAA